MTTDPQPDIPRDVEPAGHDAASSTRPAPMSRSQAAPAQMALSNDACAPAAPLQSAHPRRFWRLLDRVLAAAERAGSLVLDGVRWARGWVLGHPLEPARGTRAASVETSENDRTVACGSTDAGLPAAPLAERPNADAAQFLELLLDLDGGVLELMPNPRTPDALVDLFAPGQPIWDAECWVGPSTVRRALRHAVAQAAEGRTIREEAQVRSGPGPTELVELWLAPLEDGQGRVARLSFVGRRRGETEQIWRIIAESRSRLQAMLDGALDAVVLLSERADADGNLADLVVEELNAHAERLLGLSRHQAEGRSWCRLVPHEIGAALWHRLVEFAETGFPFQEECLIPGAGGSGRWIYQQLKRANEVLILTLRDVSDRKWAEQALAESERFARATVNALRTHLAILDERGTIVATNQMWRDFARRNHGDPSRTGERINYLEVCQRATGVGSEDAHRAADGIAAVLTGRQAEFVLEYPCHAPDQRRWFMMRASRFSSPGPVRVVVSHENITAIKLAEEERRQFAALVERSDDLIATFALDGTLLYMNQAGEQRVGLDATAIVAGPPPNLFDWIEPAEAAAELRDRILPRVRERGRYEGEFDLANPRTLQRVPTHLHLFLVERADDGMPPYLAAIGRDVTEQRRARTALQLAKDEAEAASRSKSEFLANMSHEIRTPMTAILGFADILFERLEGTEDAAAALTIRRNGTHLLEIINDILDLSKIEAGKMNVQRLPCAPVDVIADVVSLMRVRAEAKQLTLDVEYQGPLPTTIETDRTRLRQILINLVGNAIKFTRTGGVRLCVRLESQGPEPCLAIDVVDTGIGMTPEQTCRLFRPFTQVDSSATRSFSGTGLGLAISRRLAEMLGGTLDVASQAGSGSTFTLRIATGPLDPQTSTAGPAALPAATLPPGAALPSTALPNTAQPNAAPSNAALPHEPAATGDRLTCHVLLAEDGIDNQRVICHFLRQAGAEVTVVENGEQAVAAVEARGEPPFDLILMDMQMPVLDGYAATARLRQHGCRLPIIAITAHAMQGDRQRCVDAGCDDYCSKPIERAQLLKLVRRYAATGDQRAEAATEAQPPTAEHRSLAARNPTRDSKSSPAAPRPEVPSGEALRRPVCDTNAVSNHQDDVGAATHS